MGYWKGAIKTFLLLRLFVFYIFQNPIRNIWIDVDVPAAHGSSLLLLNHGWLLLEFLKKAAYSMDVTHMSQSIDKGPALLILLLAAFAISGVGVALDGKGVSSASDTTGIVDNTNLPSITAQTATASMDSTESADFAAHQLEGAPEEMGIRNKNEEITAATNAENLSREKEGFGTNHLEPR